MLMSRCSPSGRKPVGSTARDALMSTKALVWVGVVVQIAYVRGLRRNMEKSDRFIRDKSAVRLTDKTRIFRLV